MKKKIVSVITIILIGEDREHLTVFHCADTLVIDGEYFTAEDVSYLKEKGVKTIYSYLNIGSIEEFRDCYKEYREIYDGIVDILTRLKSGNMDVIINGGDVFVQEYIAFGEQNGKIFDGVNQEDVYTNYNFEENRFEINTEENREYYREYLEGLLSKGYTVYVLEYADKKEIQKKAIAYAKDQGFIAYVADNIDLK